MAGRIPRQWHCIPETGSWHTDPNEGPQPRDQKRPCHRESDDLTHVVRVVKSGRRKAEQRGCMLLVEKGSAVSLFLP